MEDPASASCCQKEAMRQAAVERQIDMLKKVDRTVIPLIERKSVIQSKFPSATESAELNDSHHDPCGQLPDQCRSHRGHTDKKESGSNCFRVTCAEQASAVLDRLGLLGRPACALFYKEDIPVLEQLISAVLMKWYPKTVFTRVSVLKTTLARSFFGIDSLPSITVFQDAQLISQSEITKFIDRNRLMTSELKDFLRNHMPCTSESDDEETESPCVVCGRDYLHEHVPALSVPIIDGSLSSEEDAD